MNSEIHTLSDQFTVQKGKKCAGLLTKSYPSQSRSKKNLGASVGFVSKIDSKSNLKKTPSGRVLISDRVNCLPRALPQLVSLAVVFSVRGLRDTKNGCEGDYTPTGPTGLTVEIKLGRQQTCACAFQQRRLSIHLMLQLE